MAEHAMVTLQVSGDDRADNMCVRSADIMRMSRGRRPVISRVRRLRLRHICLVERQLVVPLCTVTHKLRHCRCLPQAKRRPMWLSEETRGRRS